MRALMPRAIRRPLFGFLGSAYPKADWAPRVLRARTTFQGLARDSVGAYLATGAAAVKKNMMRKRSSPWLTMFTMSVSRWPVHPRIRPS